MSYSNVFMFSVVLIVLIDGEELLFGVIYDALYTPRSQALDCLRASLLEQFCSRSSDVGRPSVAISPFDAWSASFRRIQFVLLVDSELRVRAIPIDCEQMASWRLSSGCRRQSIDRLSIGFIPVNAIARKGHLSECCSRYRCTWFTPSHMASSESGGVCRVRIGRIEFVQVVSSP